MTPNYEVGFWTALLVIYAFGYANILKHVEVAPKGKKLEAGIGESLLWIVISFLILAALTTK